MSVTLEKSPMPRSARQFPESPVASHAYAHFAESTGGCITQSEASPAVIIELGNSVTF